MSHGGRGKRDTSLRLPAGMRDKGRSMKNCHMCEKELGETGANAQAVERIKFCSRKCALDFCARIFKWHKQYWASALKSLKT
jgi:hypothetical protein